MKTDDLVSLLAADAQAVSRIAVGRRLELAFACGVVVAALLMLGMLGVRADFASAALAPMFWMKVALPALVAAGALVCLERLAVPGRPLRLLWVVPALPIAMLWMASLALFVHAQPVERPALVLGVSWRACTVSIAFIAAPIFAGVFLALRDLAPTHLARAGWCAGTVAGAAAAAIYAFHCPETALPFMAIWYVLGIALPAALGGMLAPRVLRW
jgi:hypothetical protein